MSILDKISGKKLAAILGAGLIFPAASYFYLSSHDRDLEAKATIKAVKIEPASGNIYGTPKSAAAAVPPPVASAPSPTPKPVEPPPPAPVVEATPVPIEMPPPQMPPQMPVEAAREPAAAPAPLAIHKDSLALSQIDSPHLFYIRSNDRLLRFRLNQEMPPRKSAWPHLDRQQITSVVPTVDLSSGWVLAIKSETPSACTLQNGELQITRAVDASSCVIGVLSSVYDYPETKSSRKPASLRAFSTRESP